MLLLTGCATLQGLQANLGLVPFKNLEVVELRAELVGQDAVCPGMAAPVSVTAVTADVEQVYKRDHPPSATRTCPVIQLAWGRSRSSTALAMSSGSPTRPRGV